MRWGCQEKKKRGRREKGELFVGLLGEGREGRLEMFHCVLVRDFWIMLLLRLLLLLSPSFSLSLRTTEEGREEGEEQGGGGEKKRRSSDAATDALMGLMVWREKREQIRRPYAADPVLLIERRHEQDSKAKVKNTYDNFKGFAAHPFQEREAPFLLLNKLTNT